jgi:hypothetical protein
MKPFLDPAIAGYNTGWTHYYNASILGAVQYGNYGNAMGNLVKAAGSQMTLSLNSGSPSAGLNEISGTTPDGLQKTFLLIYTINAENGAVFDAYDPAEPPSITDGQLIAAWEGMQTMEFFTQGGDGTHPFMWAGVFNTNGTGSFTMQLPNPPFDSGTENAVDVWMFQLPNSFSRVSSDVNSRLAALEAMLSHMGLSSAKCGQPTSSRGPQVASVKSEVKVAVEAGEESRRSSYFDIGHLDQTNSLDEKKEPDLSDSKVLSLVRSSLGLGSSKSTSLKK